MLLSRRNGNAVYSTSVALLCDGLLGLDCCPSHLLWLWCSPPRGWARSLSTQSALSSVQPTDLNSGLSATRAKRKPVQGSVWEVGTDLTSLSSKQPSVLRLSACPSASSVARSFSLWRRSPWATEGVRAGHRVQRIAAKLFQDIAVDASALRRRGRQPRVTSAGECVAVLDDHFQPHPHGRCVSLRLRQLPGRPHG